MDNKQTEQTIDEPTKALVKVWAEKIKRAKKNNEKYVESIQKFRKYQYGEKGNIGESGLIRTNLIFSTMATLLPHIYAKNPDISVSPTPMVAKDQYGATKKLGKTCEILLDQKVVKEPKLKENAKANVRSAMVTSEGYLKMCWQEDFKTDPIIAQRIADSQDNLARIEKLIEEADDGNCKEHEAAKAQLLIEMQAMESDQEIAVYRGFAIDRVRTEDILFLDETIDEFHQYVSSGAISHMIWFTKEKYEERFGKAPYDKATKYSYKSTDKSENNSSATKEKGDFYCVHEIWDKTSNTVYTWLEGDIGWLVPPYQIKYPSKRWYPFFGLAFNVVEGRRRPLSDVELLQGLQDEYDNTRENYAQHRKESLPVRLARTNGNLTEEDIKRITNRKINDIIMIEGNPAKPINDDIAQFEGIPIDPSVYDVSAIRNDMDLMSGLSDAARGNLLQPKTATEADIMSDNMNSRVEERRDTVEDWLTDIFTSGLEIMLQAMSKAEVIAIAGEDAVWPQMTKDQIWSMVRLTLRAGSTTKPNKMRDRETWTNLLPQIQATMETVMKLRSEGNEDMANAAIELLRETLTRFDEYLDLDMFIPQPDKEDQLSQALQELQKMKQQLAEMEEQQAVLQQQADVNNGKIEEAKAKVEFENARQKGETKRHQQTLEANARTEVAKLIANLMGKVTPEQGLTVIDQIDNMANQILDISKAVINSGALEGSEQLDNAAQLN
jgi:hypothetical protein